MQQVGLSFQRHPVIFALGFAGQMIEFLPFSRVNYLGRGQIRARHFEGAVS